MRVMNGKTPRRQIEIYAKEKYGVEPEQLPFNREDYAVLRHPANGKWFAVFIVKPRKEFGLAGKGNAEIVSVKIRDPFLADALARQPGYLKGYPSPKWRWISMVLDGSLPFEDICQRLDEGYHATKTKTKNKKVPLMKRDYAICGRETNE